MSTFAKCSSDQTVANYFRNMMSNESLPTISPPSPNATEVYGIVVKDFDTGHNGIGGTNFSYTGMGGCGAFGMGYLVNDTKVSATVVTVKFGDPYFSVWLSNCDETSKLNVTKPGVYMLQGNLISVIIERQGACNESSHVELQRAALIDYCPVDPTFKECATVKGTSAAASTVKRSTIMMMVTTLAVLLTTINA